MTTAMMKALEAEIDFMSNWLSYSDTDGLEEITSLEEAQVEIDGILGDYDGDDFPEGLKDPATMMIVFNHCFEQEFEKAEQRRQQEEDDRIAATHPDWIRIRNRYNYGRSAFFDPVQIEWELSSKLHYDDVHRAIFLEALSHYQEACKND